MTYLSHAYDLAEGRGYFLYPEVAALKASVPDWFRTLGTQDGAIAFEKRNAVTLPAALREFYICDSLACFLEASGDGEVFLRELAECMEHHDFPPLVKWSSELYVVVGFHGHSGYVFAVSVTGDDPLALWGFMDDSAPSTGPQFDFRNGFLMRWRGTSASLTIGKKSVNIATQTR
jgi:hypothetical protein